MKLREGWGTLSCGIEGCATRQATVGVMVARVSTRLGAIVGDEVVPFIGQIAGAYIIGSAIKDGVESFNDNIGNCQ